MRNDAIYGRVLLQHEGVKPLQVSVARVDNFFKDIQAHLHADAKSQRQTRQGFLHVMRNKTVYGGVPLRHESVKPLQISVARVHACKISETLQTRQVLDFSHLCPESPIIHNPFPRLYMLISLGLALYNTVQDTTVRVL